MTILGWLAAIFCLATTILHLGTIGLALARCRKRLGHMAAPPGGPAVSIVRPVCGLDRHEEATLRSGFALDYPDVELIFCCARADDPAVALVRRLIAQHPNVEARLLVGNHVISSNPKLNNVVKGWRAARSDWIILADSNVDMPRDYVQRLLLSWKADTGILCSPPIGTRPEGFWAELECAFLNTYQARWQYAADSLGLGFAQGKTMLLRRPDLARAGGIGALACEVAEDAAATKVIRGLGLRAALVDAPFGQPLGRRTARQVWGRQTRWSRLRRITFPGYYVAEILTGSLLPLAAGAYAAIALECPLVTVMAALAAVWFGAEAVLARAAGWQISVLSPLAWALRDMLLPAVWLQAWTSDSFEWRGSAIHPVESGAPAS